MNTFLEHYSAKKMFICLAIKSFKLPKFFASFIPKNLRFWVKQRKLWLIFNRWTFLNCLKVLLQSFACVFKSLYLRHDPAIQQNLLISQSSYSLFHFLIKTINYLLYKLILNLCPVLQCRQDFSKSNFSNQMRFI